MQTIYFYATLGDMSQPAFGGGETGNRRTLALLRELGYNVIPIPKYGRLEKGGIRAKVQKIADVVKNLRHYYRLLSMGNPDNSVVHIAGFSGSMVYLAFVLITIAKNLGYKVVYELRGGRIIEQYHENTPTYRSAFDNCVKKADYIFSQGLPNQKLIVAIKPDAKFYYYPNYVEPGFSPDLYPQKPNDCINLMYFGRLSRTKNIELIIDIFEDMSLRSSKPVTLTLIGNPENEEYWNVLSVKISNSPHHARIHLVKGCSHRELQYHLADKHFYLFPTRENGEGHSNALTEAMIWGLIPIATDQGFNRDVIGDDGLIVDKLDVYEFVNVVDRIMSSGVYDETSKSIYERAGHLYSYSSAKNNLPKEYEKVFATKCIR